MEHLQIQCGATVIEQQLEDLEHHVSRQHGDQVFLPRETRVDVEVSRSTAVSILPLLLRKAIVNPTLTRIAYLILRKGT